MSRAFSGAAFVALALAAGACGGDPAPAAPASLRAPVGDSPQRGRSDAWVTIVEFSDFQCPFCGREAPVLAQALAAYGDDLRLVYEHFPLDAVHARARPVAIAAECARAQGKFWEMHDALFADQAALSDADLAARAAALGLDLAAWDACRSGSDAAARVERDRQLGVALGVAATPTLAVNGEPVVGAATLEELKAVVDRALAAARASGIPRDRYYDTAVLGGT